MSHPRLRRQDGRSDSRSFKTKSAKGGGATGWKLGPAAADLAGQARNRGKWVHMGRVNSLRRLSYAQAIGCHSVDGTYMAYGPDRNLPTLLRWLAAVNRASQPSPGPACPAHQVRGVHP